MPGKRYSEEQIVRILGPAGRGRTVAQTARDYGRGVPKLICAVYGAGMLRCLGFP